MINIDENRVIIKLKEYNLLNPEIKKEIEKNINVKIFKIIFSDNTNQNIRLLKKMKKENQKEMYCGVKYYNYNLIGIIDNENDEIISCIKAIFIKNRDDRYEFIYNNLCKQLDQIWNKENPCKFENNICISERMTAKHPRENGCCYAFWYKKCGLQIFGVHQCEHLDSKEYCKNPNITCKLFVCPYLKKHSKFKIKIDKLLLVQVFLNRYQKIVIKNNFFITRNEFIEKLKRDEKNLNRLFYIMLVEIF